VRHTCHIHTLCHSWAYLEIGARRGDGLRTSRAQCWHCCGRSSRLWQQARRPRAYWTAVRLRPDASDFIAYVVRQVSRSQALQDVCWSRAKLTAGRAQMFTVPMNATVMTIYPIHLTYALPFRACAVRMCHTASKGAVAVRAYTRVRWRWVLCLRALATCKMR
jgi:hypothetical protein